VREASIFQLSVILFFVEKMRVGPMKPVHCTAVEKREWHTLIFQFLLLIFFHVQSASDHCDRRYNAG